MTERYRFDSWLTTTQNSELCAEEILSSIRSRVRIWTEKEIARRDEPHYYAFIREYPEYIHDGWRSTIEIEIERTVKEEDEHKNFGLPFYSKKIQGA
ncbi:hypothetical protein BK133_00980 [Paenibacillus sp. FSL H8-0548]|uniref:hypothetical protein n=1 Tax=Paenibacillus sp. FSL H8-0548 TaxID=1920422 RepID=UPI00096DB1E0|nr:hypothetical protein [Paenibacillus sp. FSL H8-0548]OMF38808.1 hypothetical protein BK133_00980 [Paenibacillus sp. FSL H8-0548]